MTPGFQGAHVLCWSQTELDGTGSAPIAHLRAGACWRWTGDAVRIDGPADILPLGAAAGAEDLRNRAARKVRRLLRAVAADTPDRDRLAVAQAAPEAGFTVTDGRRIWALSLIEQAGAHAGFSGIGRDRPPLLLILGDLPPRDRDLWVVSQCDAPARRASTGDPRGGVVCFTPGTLIATETGPVPVEAIREGTKVQTKDNGCQEVVWIGRRRVTGARLQVQPHLAPVRLRAGALGARVPDGGLLVSPDHRIVLRGVAARALFNTDEVLVAARDLVNDGAIRFERGLIAVTYIHLLLPAHQIIFANGVETDSFHPAAAAFGGMAEDQLDRLCDCLRARLPDVAADPQSYGAYARRVLSASEAAILRHDLAA